MVNKVRKFIEENKIFKNGDSVVLGISGGADSMCLLYVLKSLKDLQLDLHVVHVNHHIRAEEAQRDADFVRRVCQDNDIEFRQIDVNIPEIVSQTGQSEEEAGRIERYKAFRQVAGEIGADKIAVAHNINDNSETILFNLFRGTGIRGLTGIEPVNDMIARPLLCCTRDEIEQYNKENNILFVHDSTNSDTEYSRNKIRLELMPYIENNINQKAMNNIVNAASSLKDIADYMEGQIDNAYALYVKDDEIRDEAMELPRAIKTGIVRKLIENKAGRLKDVTRVHICKVLELSGKQVSKMVDLPYDLVAKKTYNGIKIEKNRKNEESGETEEFIILSDGKLHSNRYVSASLEKTVDSANLIDEEMCTKWLDYGKIHSLTVRNRRPGDYIVVDDKGSRKKLKDYFIDQKIPREDRDRILLVADGSHIAWIIGYRISSYYKITEHTKEIIRLDAHIEE